MRPKYAYTTLAVAFPALVVAQSALFYLLPPLVPFLLGTMIAIYGGYATFRCAMQLVAVQTLSHWLVAALLIATWLGWTLVPTRDFAIHARFWLEQRDYEHAAAEFSAGNQPQCIKTQRCLLGGKQLIFPYPGLLSGWIGIVYVPEETYTPDIQSLKQVSADAGCESAPIGKHFYVCGFY